MDSERKAELRKKFKVFSVIFKLILFLVIIVGIPLYLYFFQKDLIHSFSSMENVRALFAQYKAQSVLFYILAQDRHLRYSGTVASVHGRIHVGILAGIPVLPDRSTDRIRPDLLYRTYSRT